MASYKVKGFVSGTQNKQPSEEIARDAASDALGWVTEDGRTKLVGGRAFLGADGALGGVFGQIFAPKKDGTRVHYRKINTKIQYWTGTTWADVITGLTAGANYTFCPYISLAGAYVYAVGVDGMYKIATANPASYKNMFNETYNYKGYALINDQRMLLWNRSNGNPDKMGVYLSKIDPQGANYSTVTNEVVTGCDGVTLTYSGTLAQATGTRFVFGLSMTLLYGTVTAVDNYVGVISGTGVTGTINYATGAWSLTFTSPPVNTDQIRISYQYEDSNVGGLTDFRFTSPTRLAGEGDIISQEYLGEPIQNILVFEGKYYSLKKRWVYELDLGINDTTATNKVFRSGIGIPSLRSAVSTSLGMIYIDTANPDRPILSMLERRNVGDGIEPRNLTPQFDWSNYTFDECVIDTFGESIILSAKTVDANENDIMFNVNVSNRYSVDPLPYGANTFAQESGVLYAGDSFTDTVYSMFTGHDDISFIINNYRNSKAENYGSDRLKRFRFLQFKGLIDPSQVVEVYASFDGGDFTLLGTIRGDADYVDYDNPETLGGSELGGESIGGGATAFAYPYHMQMRTRVPKFLTRVLRFVATNIGYVDVQEHIDEDILAFEQKLPRRFRLKQHVSLDGATTNLDTFAD